AQLSGRHATSATAALAELTELAAARGGSATVSLRRRLASLRTAPKRPGGPPPGTPRRTFFPKGNAVRTWTEPERRDPLPRTATEPIRATVDGELAARAARLDRFDVAVLDAALARVPAPARERAGSEQLAGWPRGSIRPLAGAPVIRLFLHWVDRHSDRVDLDLSCAFYNQQWAQIGHCDYTALFFGDRAAVHSGDLTSAPPPLGATEYLDLHRERLLDEGVAWAVPVVLSYNDVPFEALDAALAGFSLPQDEGATFDAARVLQRFSLRGDTRSLAPLILDVRTGDVMWIDAAQTTSGYAHNVATNGPRLGRIAADLWEHFTAGIRPTLLDLAAWHAAARADRVLVAHPDGTATAIPAAAPADVVAAVRSVASGEGGGGTAQIPVPGRTFAATTDPARLPAGAADGSLALLVDGTAPAPWTQVAAPELMAGLTP
ncbi:hypothetical protein, partial [Dactylosporangium salmoneum]|uniref:hypothetical protein n=1 Tax=Dactylosporangium salmoneum TaxID=53361 RepID=UPI0031DB9495